MKVLGIETSCDETAIAVVEDGRKVLSTIVASSLALHKQYGGIVPEIATRHHVEVILAVLDKALKDASSGFHDVDVIAVTQGPGLIGSLMIGITLAKSLAMAIGKPIVTVDHILAHIFACSLDGGLPQFPFLGLVVSGGHTSLFIVYGFQKFKLLGRTRDDALGEAYDKVAKILRLGFPGGPVIENMALQAIRRDKNMFPIAKIKHSFDFSYSGLKTAVLYYVKERDTLSSQEVNEICYSFQESALYSLIPPLKNAISEFGLKRLVVGGGVAVNRRLRELLQELGVELHLPSLRYCMDNAAMVAGLGYWVYNENGDAGFQFGPYSTFEERWSLVH